MIEGSLESLLHTLNRMYIGHIRHELESRGVSDTVHPPILFMLYHAKGRPMTQREIAHALGISPPTVTMSVKRMEKAGFVRKQADEADLRKSYITLTEEGKRCAEEIEVMHRALGKRLLTGFTAQETEQFLDFYRRVIRNLEHPDCRRPHFWGHSPCDK